MVVTGHSLGAALASITGVWAALQWPAADIYVPTFGEPKPGNRQFGEVPFLCEFPFCPRFLLFLLLLMS